MGLFLEEKSEEKIRKKNEENCLKINFFEEKEDEEYSHFQTGGVLTVLSRA